MGRRHLVRDGESLETIAARYGHLPDTVWQDGANAELRQKRADPRVLAAGDVVNVPDLRPRVESAATGSRHRYRRKAVPLKLDVALLDAFGEPRAGLPFTLVADGARVEGMTNADGHAIGWVPIDAKLTELHIEGEVYELALHWLDPVDTPAGLAARLANLGLLDPALADEDEELALAIRAFQRKHDIEPSGEADEATRAKLVEVHRS